MISGECYVSFETAVLLRDKGFDWPCLNRYVMGVFVENKHLEVQGYYINSKTEEEVIAAPTLQVAMKWLREKHNLVVNPVGHYSNGVLDKWEADIYTLDSGIDATYNASGHIYGETYEDAVEAGITYCLILLM